MDKLLEKLIESLTNGNILLVPVVIVFGLLINAKKIADFWEERKQARKTKITEALASELIVGETRKYFESELVREHFKLIDGLNLEGEHREALLSAHSQCKGEVKFLHFKRALPHLKFKDSRMIVQVSFWDKLFGLLNLLMGLFLVVFGSLLLFLIGQIPDITLSKVLYVLIMGLVCLVFGLFFGAQSTSVYSAKVITPYLEDTECERTDELDNEKIS